jgi:hypothetical protein
MGTLSWRGQGSTPQAARGNQHLLRRGDASQKIDSSGQLLMAMRSSGLWFDLSLLRFCWGKGGVSFMRPVMPLGM